MNTEQQQSMYESFIETLTEIHIGIKSVYTCKTDDFWNAEDYQTYCNAVGAKRDDPIQGLLKAIDRLIASIPEPIEAEPDKDTTQDMPQMIVAVYPVETPDLSEIIPIDAILNDSQYLGNLYRPAGQYRVMECVHVRHKPEHPLWLGFNINPDENGKPWIQYYKPDDCVLISADVERAA